MVAGLPSSAPGGHACALERLESGRAGTLLVVAAHPDDETIGLGATLGSLAEMGWRVEVLHVTDGAPRDVALRPTLRHATALEAARVRRHETEAALRAAGLDPSVVLLPSLDVSDQEAALSMVSIARSVIARLAAFPADVVVTHPYEGGHPDHDSVAFAVHAAVGPSGLRGSATAPRLAEMTSYHGAEGSLSTSRFLTVAGAACDRRREGILDAALRNRKRAMLNVFVTQAEMLAPFGTTAEPLRCAPSYDFTRAPHPGAIHYEGRPFGWTGARWRELARAAMEELGMQIPKSP